MHKGPSPASLCHPSITGHRGHFWHLPQGPDAGPFWISERQAAKLEVCPHFPPTLVPSVWMYLFVHGVQSQLGRQWDLPPQA